MPLTDTKVRTAKPAERPYKLAGGAGLTLLVKPSGSKLWRFRYRYGGRENMLALGRYPDVTLRMARDRCQELRRQLAGGIDPSAARHSEREARTDTLAAIGKEWLAKQRLADITVSKAKWMLETFVYPSLGNRPIRDIKPADLLRVLRKIEATGRHETARRTKQRVGQIYRYAVATGRADHDITASLAGALTPPQTKHRAAITEPAAVGALLRAIDGYDGHPSVTYALRLAPLVFVRPGELRAAEWSEIDLKAAEWRIPDERMKMGARHIVPLSRQAVAIVRELESLTRYSRYLFPSLRTADRCISDNSLNAALRRLGYGTDDQTAHGFRTVASTLLNEMGWHPDLIELQLAHKPRDKVRAAYNRAERLKERRKMMQAWADYLDALKAGAKVMTIRG